MLPLSPSKTPSSGLADRWLHYLAGIMLKLCLGGTFDPIHHAHLICARAAAEAVGADAVVLIPAARAPHKPDVETADERHRLIMCQLAVQGVNGFVVDDREMRRGGASFTIDTIISLRKEGYTDLAWLIGADLVATLPTWRRINELVQHCRLVIVARPGWKFDWTSLPTNLGRLLQENVVTVPQMDISATEIRERIKMGLPIDFLTPSAVCRYIHENALYR